MAKGWTVEIITKGRPGSLPVRSLYAIAIDNPDKALSEVKRRVTLLDHQEAVLGDWLSDENVAEHGLRIDEMKQLK
ncbi:hypothetical protein [Vineibacter terrae]|uniref:Uncharacterized protein n=1 Tax=Vineibacter terrae TaxID=2586908 RepID=A0A5C8PDZ9_9HYPH|nr:hypothetical protein [Vineibacter terrae]TXL71955.1 hypothetical protein FHP25_27350 [Vineibacter terrae]HEX2886723.1 hypothetical protein [Vineibacter terrae]